MTTPPLPMGQGDNGAAPPLSERPPLVEVPRAPSMSSSQAVIDARTWWDAGRKYRGEVKFTRSYEVYEVDPVGVTTHFTIIVAYDGACQKLGRLKYRWHPKYSWLLFPHEDARYSW